MARGEAKQHPAESALATLCEPDLGNRPRYAAALCELIAWMRWPYAPGFANNMSRMMYLMYVSGQNVADEPFKSSLVELALQTKFQFIVSHEDIGFEVATFGLDADQYSYLSQVVRFLVSYEPDPAAGSRGRASLGKAHFGLMQGLYGKKWHKSETSRDEIWRKFKSCSAFVATDVLFHGGLLQLDLKEPSFSADLGRMLMNPGPLRRYLATAKWTQKHLQSQLDRVAIRDAHFPRFPENLTAVRLRTTGTTDRQRALMKSYRSTRF